MVIPKASRFLPLIDAHLPHPLSPCVPKIEPVPTKTHTLRASCKVVTSLGYATQSLDVLCVPRDS